MRWPAFNEIITIFKQLYLAFFQVLETEKESARGRESKLQAGTQIFDPGHRHGSQESLDKVGPADRDRADSRSGPIALDLKRNATGLLPLASMRVRCGPEKSDAGDAATPRINRN